jgi:hypothetical protein
MRRTPAIQPKARGFPGEIVDLLSPWDALSIYDGKVC